MTATGGGDRMIDIYPQGAGAVEAEGIEMSGLKLIRYSYTSATNDEMLYIRNANNVKIDDIQCTVIQSSTNDYAATAQILLYDVTNLMVTDI